MPEAKRKGEGGKLEREGKGGGTGGKKSWYVYNIPYIFFSPFYGCVFLFGRFQRVRESIFGKKKDKDTKEVE